MTSKSNNCVRRVAILSVAVVSVGILHLTFRVYLDQNVNGQQGSRDAESRADALYPQPKPAVQRSTTCYHAEEPQLATVSPTSQQPVREPGEARTLDYCNLPEVSRPLGEEGMAPIDYSLRMVQVVIREGVRNSRYNSPNIAFPKISCRFVDNEAGSYDYVASAFKKAMDALSSNVNGQDFMEGLDLYPDSAECEADQLTWLGVRQLLNLGDLLRNRYTSRGFLKQPVTDVERILFRSSARDKTFQSGLALIFGMFPRLNFRRLKPELIDAKRTNLCSENTDLALCACPAISRLQKRSRSEKPPAGKSVQKEAADFLGFDSGRRQFMSDLLDTMTTYTCHGLALPCTLSDSERCATWGLLENIWDDKDRRGQKRLSGPYFQAYRDLHAYPLLHEIINRMVHVSRGQSQTTVVVYSGYDSTLVSLTSALGIFDGIWPPFASRLVFELYSGADDTAFFVRVLYNGEDTTASTLKVCADSQLVDGLCPLKNFLDFLLRGDLLRDKLSYVQACTL